MKCPFCGETEDKVVDSRVTEDNDVIRRRRECLGCKGRFTTYERIEEIPLTIVKKNGERELFDRGKFMTGLMRATNKRQIPMSVLEQLVDQIEDELRNEFKHEVPSRELGGRVLQKLKDIDKVAYIRFASVYREFKDVDEFTAELKKLQ